MLVCDDFDAFVEALPGLDGRYLLRSPQSRDWWLRAIDFGGISITTGQEGAARIYDGASQRDSCHAFLLREGAGQEARVDGRPIDARTIAWTAPGSAFHTTTSRPVRWLNITMHSELLTAMGAVHPDAHLLRQRDCGFFSFRPDACRRIGALADRIFEQEARFSRLNASSHARRVAREELASAVLQAVAPVRSARAAAPSATSQRRVVQRTLALVERNEDVTIHDMCEATAVSERTLRNAFHAYFGLSPHRYLMLKRLHWVRSALEHPRSEDTVASTCARFGIWDFGRFAASFRQLFGVLPSEILKRSRVA